MMVFMPVVLVLIGQFCHDRIEKVAFSSTHAPHLKKNCFPFSPLILAVPVHLASLVPPRFLALHLLSLASS